MHDFCVCVCVCVRERERGREKERVQKATRDFVNNSSFIF